MARKQAVLGTLATLLISGCGAGGGARVRVAGDFRRSADPVAEAAQRSANAGTVAFTVIEHVNMAGQRLKIRGSGVIDLKADRGQIALSIPVADGPRVSFALITDVAAFLRLAESSREFGHRQIDGVDTTHYRTQVDFGRLADGAGPRLRATLDSYHRHAGVSSLPIDTWVGHDGLLRRERARMRIKSSATNAVPVTVHVRVDFKHYGVPIAIDPPQPSETSDAADLLSQVAAHG